MEVRYAYAYGQRHLPSSRSPFPRALEKKKREIHEIEGAFLLYDGGSDLHLHSIDEAKRNKHFALSLPCHAMLVILTIHLALVKSCRAVAVHLRR